MDKTKFKEGFQKYTMIIVLRACNYIFRMGNTGQDSSSSEY